MKKKNYSEIDACIVCGDKKFELIFYVNDICLTGFFPEVDQPDPIKTPITVQRCIHCNNVQMREKVNPELMFGDYWYRSSTTKSMIAHLQATLTKAEKAGGVFLDIGCNDGTLMELAAANGMDVYGVDPSVAVWEAKKKFNDRVFADFFTKDLVLSSLSSMHSSFSLVTAISIFYDVSDPVDFLSGIELLLKDDGVALIEVNYAKSFFERSNVDMLGQEHLIYYFISTFQKVLDKTNLNLYDAYLTDMNGGNIAFLISKRKLPQSLGLIKLMEEEERWISNFNFKNFQSDVMASFSIFKQWLLKTTKSRSVKILGASTRGAFIAQLLSLNNKQISSAVDLQQNKKGRRMPGTNIVIEYDPEHLPPDYYLVMPYQFKEEILKRYESYMKGGGYLIFYRPLFEIYSWSQSRNVLCKEAIPGCV